MKKIKSFIIIALFLSANALLAFDVPFNGKMSHNPKNMKVEQKGDVLVIKLPKTEKKITFAGITFLLPKPVNFSEFTGVRYTIKSNQPVKTKCHFGTYKSAMKYKKSWPGFVVTADTEKNVEFTKADFIPTKDTNGSIDKVRNIDIAFGLWNYDTTQNELEIEISKFEIILPAEKTK